MKLSFEELLHIHGWLSRRVTREAAMYKAGKMPHVDTTDCSIEMPLKHEVALACIIIMRELEPYLDGILYCEDPGKNVTSYEHLRLSFATGKDQKENSGEELLLSSVKLHDDHNGHLPFSEDLEKDTQRAKEYFDVWARTIIKNLLHEFEELLIKPFQLFGLVKN